MNRFLSFLKDKGSSLLEKVEKEPMTFPGFLVSFVCILLFRIILEDFLDAFAVFNGDIRFVFVQFSHTFFFFSIATIVSFFLMKRFFQSEIRPASNIILIGTFFLSLLSPVLDWILSGGKGFRSYYEFGNIQELSIGFVTLLGVDPLVGITPGPRIMMIASLVGLFGYGYLKTGRFWKPFVGVLMTYALFYVLGTFPSWLTILLKGSLSIEGVDVAAVFFTPMSFFSSDLMGMEETPMLKLSLFYSLIFLLLFGVFLFVFFRKIFLSLLHNARIPQIIYHCGIFSLGFLLAINFTDTSFPKDVFHILGFILLLIATIFSWIASIIVNDLYDTRIDTLTNTDRPLITKTIDRPTYRMIGLLFFVFSLFFSALVSPAACVLMLTYQGVAFLYSAPPLRLKRFPFIATGLSSIAVLLIFFAGYITGSPEKNLHALPFQIPVFLFLAFTCILPVKDFKDIAGDRADHVLTLPVLLGAGAAKLLLGSLIFFFYIASPLILRSATLYLPALLFGSLAFWSIQKGNPEKTSFFFYRNLSGITLGIVILYGIIATLLLFEDRIAVL